MDKAMTASVEATGTGMTDGQIDTFVDKLRASLRKHRSDISSDVAQQVQGLDNLGMDMFAVIRQHAERISNTIVRRVKVDRTRTPHEALDATGRNQYTDMNAAAGMPKGEGDEVELIYFKPDADAYKNGIISDDDLAKEFEKHGFEPDPMAQTADNEADPAFADEHPNGAHWKDKNGKWCYVAFGRWLYKRYVHVDRGDGDWRGDWWFAGVRKVSA